MIPNGVTPADDNMAADIWGWSVGYWRDRKHWEDIPGLVLLRAGGHRRSRIFSKEQLIAAHVEEQRAKAQNVLPKYELPPVPTGEHPDDLLDLEEALQALPEHRRVSMVTWKTYRYGNKTRLPDPDLPNFGAREIDGKDVGGTDFWRRRTILEWDANRPERGGPPGRSGRKPGSKDKQPRHTITQVRAQKNLALVRSMLDSKGANIVTAQTVADFLGIHPGHAERVLREARVSKIRDLLKENPDLTIDDVMRELGLHVVAHARKILDAADDGNFDTQ
ncbi:hypothetical protein [Streptomyces rubradiris]|uniref:hypothetical protein n=1 Tax=Streptomyces rubradiris TaxID=285531 RepID=UPI001679E636|nr:hypothetical protein [Streptomyces rubradiris]GHH25661.1 hypothetical protein GCM10018792_64920 [Streptomyces rubradiris]